VNSHVTTVGWPGSPPQAGPAARS